MADVSYPPIFRQPNTGDDSGRPLNPPDHQACLEIPVVDLQNLDPGRLGEACREWGIFRLANHGIPQALSARLLDQARGILSSPFESKRAQFSDDPVNYFWGTPAVTQRVRTLNWFEGLHILLSHHQSGGGDGGGDPESGSCSSSSSAFRDARWDPPATPHGGDRCRDFLGGRIHTVDGLLCSHPCTAGFCRSEAEKGCGDL